MKVVVDGRHIDGKNNGLTRYITNLTIALSEKLGGKLVILSNKDVILPSEVLKRSNIHIDHSIWSRLPGSVWLMFRVPYILKELECDRFLGTQHVLPLHKPSNIKYGLIMHDLVYVYFPNTMKYTNRVLSKFLVPRSLRIADVIFTVSESTKMSIHDIYPELSQPVKVTYPGFAFEKVPKPTYEKKIGYKFLCVGSIEPRKNLSKMLDVYQEMALKSDLVSLDLVCGSTWASDEVSKKLTKLGTKVVVYENISDDLLCQLYQEANVMLFPSHYEGFGLPILESIGNCSIIANNISVFKELAVKIDNMKLIDFSKDVDVIAKEILIFKNIAPAKFKNEYSYNEFSWTTNADIVISSLSL